MVKVSALPAAELLQKSPASLLAAPSCALAGQRPIQQTAADGVESPVSRVEVANSVRGRGDALK